MNKVKTYEPELSPVLYSNDEEIVMEEADYGDWVKLEDYEKLEKDRDGIIDGFKEEVKFLKGELKELKEYHYSLVKALTGRE